MRIVDNTVPFSNNLEPSIEIITLELTNEG